jgi:NAD-dependent dihydropyrimidine dehydrogenase PreA subunit
MAGRDYMGIPREEIPWYPTINTDLCINDSLCIDFCSNDVFAQGELTTIVANPYNCVVGCSACAKECPVGAITFPDKKELVKILNELRPKYAAPKS